LHQCAVEESMACGIGVCMTCVIPLKDETGTIKMQRSCIEGPVVDGSKVIWGSSRQIPPGTLGSQAPLANKHLGSQALGVPTHE
ncbi:MAG: hypothetical protein ACKOD6_03330, partial [Actinomycetota bacterium]